MMSRTLGTHTYVEGPALVGLILEVREEFLKRIPYELDDSRQPNSLRLVAIDIFDGKPTCEQLSVLHDLIDANARYVVARAERDIFEYADTPAAYLTDLVCEVVREVLVRDPEIRREDERRIELAIESADELAQVWADAAEDVE